MPENQGSRCIIYFVKICEKREIRGQNGKEKQNKLIFFPKTVAFSRNI